MIKKNPPMTRKPQATRLVSEEIISKLNTDAGEWFFIGRKCRSSWARAVSTYAKGIEIITRNYDGRDADIYLRSKA